MSGMAPEPVKDVVVASLTVALVQETPPAAVRLIHLRVERRKEQVLQDGLVIRAGIRRWILEQILDLPGLEQGIGDQSLACLGIAFLAQKPAEDETCQEANQHERRLAVGIHGRVFGKYRVFTRPEVPVGDLLMERLGELLDIERLIVPLLYGKGGYAEENASYGGEIEHLDAFGSGA
ncbi:MAG: hypothetical protein FJW35_04560 [Acidobacteria bacterium]|nr:hypothetical protein [Acidobacteriota bacterium]